MIDALNEEEEMKDKPDQANADRRAYDAIFGNRMYMTRLVYRIPFFILELFVILLFSVLVPVLAGTVLIFGMKIIGNEYAFLIRLLGYWCVGLVTIGGAGIAIFVLLAFWSALKDSAVRLWKLIRKKD